MTVLASPQQTKAPAPVRVVPSSGKPALIHPSTPAAPILLSAPFPLPTPLAVPATLAVLASLSFAVPVILAAPIRLLAPFSALLRTPVTVQEQNPVQMPLPTAVIIAN